MKKNTEPPVIEPTQPETAAPAVGEMETLPPIAAAPKNTPVSFNFTDEAAQEEDMNPVRDILQAGQAETEEMLGMDLVILTVEEVATFLKCTYDVQGWISFPDIWKRDDSFYHEIAAGILPNINAWAAKFPAVAHAVKTVSAAGSWGRLIWDVAGNWILVVRRRQLEAEKKKKEEEQNQNAGYTVNYSSQQQQQPAANNTGAKHGYIIP